MEKLEEIDMVKIENVNLKKQILQLQAQLLDLEAKSIEAGVREKYLLEDGDKVGPQGEIVRLKEAK